MNKLLAIASTFFALAVQAAPADFNGVWNVTGTYTDTNGAVHALSAVTLNLQVSDAAIQIEGPAFLLPTSVEINGTDLMSNGTKVGTLVDRKLNVDMDLRDNHYVFAMEIQGDGTATIEDKGEYTNGLWDSVKGTAVK